MRSVSTDSRADDLSTRARIRDAAIRRFGLVGFGAPVRAIATEARVSPGLVMHHFGSKDALRAVCDEHVLRAIREAKTDILVKAGPADFIAALATVEQYAPLTGYLVQALRAGGDFAATFLDRLTADTELYLQEAVEAGRVLHSRDPAARARFLVSAGTGALLVYLGQQPAADGDLGATLRAYTAAIALPALELYTEGLLTDRSLLDGYLVHLADRSGPAEP